MGWLFLVTLLLLLPQPALANPGDNPAARSFPLDGPMPLTFVPNRGQSDPLVRFQAQALGGSLFFTDRGLTLQLPSTEATASVSLRFEGANPTPTIIGRTRLVGRVNYLIGSNPDRWHTNLPTYGGVQYHQLYDGINLIYEGQDGQLKGTYYVAAGADPAQIRWRYEGAVETQLDESANLVVTLPDSLITLTEQAPIAWQVIAGRARPVPVAFALAQDGSIGFNLPAGYDSTRPLVIDPTLTYGTYLGGNSDDEIRAVTVDGQGNIYLTGLTYSTDFPGTGGRQNNSKDIFVTRLNPQGTALSWSTYIGGGDTDEGHALALDGKGSLWVTGFTESPDFPISAGGNSFAGYYDVIAVKLNAATGGKVFSNVYGGENLDAGYGIAVGQSGRIYIGGQSNSDVLVMSLNGQTNSVLQSVTFGRERGEDIAYALALDTDDAVYLTGVTAPSGQNTDFPTTEDAFQSSCGIGDVFGDCGEDAFITMLDADLTSILYSTYLGGSYNNSEISSGNDVGTGIGVGSDGSVYVTGYTLATDFPTHNAIQATKRGADNFSDAFVTRLNPATSQLIFSTYLGGDAWDEGHALTLDGQNNVYVAGLTNALNFPIKDAAQSSLGNGICNLGGSERYCYDGFATKLTAAGALDWSTFIGGDDDDNAHAVALEPGGGLLVAGGTESFDFPVSAGALQPTKSLSRDAFLVRLGSGDSAPPPGDKRAFLPLVIR